MLERARAAVPLAVPSRAVSAPGAGEADTRTEREYMRGLGTSSTRRRRPAPRHDCELGKPASGRLVERSGVRDRVGLPVGWRPTYAKLVFGSRCWRDRCLTTLDGGSLGSRVDEGRS